MKRRDFLGVLGGAAAWPMKARAQQPAMPVIGFLRNTSAASSVNLVTAFRQGLKEVGYSEGRNVGIDFRWAEGHYDQLPILAADLVRRPVAVFVAANLTTLVAAKAATETIPIVFVTGDDPVQLGLVASLNQPADNVTGVSFYSGTLGAKGLEILGELMPKAAALGMLVNQSSPAAEDQISNARVAASALGRQIHIVNAGSEGELDTAFATLVQRRAGALLVSGNALFTAQRDRLVALAARHALPTMYYAREFVAVGGLMSYGASITDAYRQVGIYTGRILKGEKPADLPIMLPTKFELVINLKTAKALNLTIPESFLLRADEVIE